MARAPVNMSYLQFVKRIPKLNLSRNHTEFLQVWAVPWLDFYWGGCQLGPYKFVKKILAKIDKISLNFKNFHKVLKGFKVNF